MADQATVDVTVKGMPKGDWERYVSRTRQMLPNDPDAPFTLIKNLLATCADPSKTFLFITGIPVEAFRASDILFNDGQVPESSLGLVTHRAIASMIMSAKEGTARLVKNVSTDDAAGEKSTSPDSSGTSKSG